MEDNNYNDELNDNLNEEENVSIDNNRPYVKNSRDVLHTAGRTGKAIGNGVQFAGKATNLAGKGTDALGKGLSKAGSSLSTKGYGAFVGVPLKALGDATSGVGKGMQAIGKAADKSGKNIKNTSNSLNNKVLKKAKDVIKTTHMAGGFLSHYKLIIIFISIAIVIIILFMFMIMVLISSGEIDDAVSDKSYSSVSYSGITSNVNGSTNDSLWYPIGSDEITTSVEVDGYTIEFRSGTPVYTSLTSSYGKRGNKVHNGIDIAASGDIYLIAMDDGQITYISSNRDSGYYNTQPSGESYTCVDHGGMVEIQIEYDNGYKSRYLHLEGGSIPDYLRVNSKVYQGQVVGKMGNTGCSTGQHLHYELLVNNLNVNPDNYVNNTVPRPMLDGVYIKSEDLLKNSFSDNGDFIEGNTDQQTVCLNLKKYYSDNVVAGLMVNIEKESDFNSEIESIDTDGYPSGGLFQWHLDRLNALKSRYGDDWILISNQIEYFQYELSTTESATATILNNNSLSVSEVAFQFCETFERAENCTPRKNEDLVNKYSTYVNNGCK